MESGQAGGTLGEHSLRAIEHGADELSRLLGLESETAHASYWEASRALFMIFKEYSRTGHFAP